MRKADLHLHSDYSDGSDTVQELVKNIVTKGLSTFALTDHDTISGCVEIQKYLPQNVNFISGCELTSICDTVKCHILGYYCDPFEETLTKLIEKGRKLRRAKLEKANSVFERCLEYRAYKSRVGLVVLKKQCCKNSPWKYLGRTWACERQY